MVGSGTAVRVRGCACAVDKGDGLLAAGRSGRRLGGGADAGGVRRNGSRGARPAVPDRPGGLDRSEAWWERRLLDIGPRGGASALRYAPHRSAGGEVDGYAMYRVKEDWTPDGPTGEVRVADLAAATGPARAALWGTSWTST